MVTKRLKHLKDLMIRARANASESITVMVETLRALEVHGDLCEKARAINERRAVVEIIVKAHSRIQDIDTALARMTDGSYGLCLECEEQIGESRLLAQPWAETCVSCQGHRESERLNHSPGDVTYMMNKQMEAAWRA